jgi:hypothetical protein
MKVYILFTLLLCSFSPLKSQINKNSGSNNPFEMVFILSGIPSQLQVQNDGFIKMVPMIINPPDSAYFGEFFSNKDLQGDTVLQKANDINFIWPTKIQTFQGDSWSDRWIKTGLFLDSTYTFSINADDGVRLYIDDSLLIDQWHGVYAPTEYTVDETMTYGYHKIVIEHYNESGPASLKFSYKIKQL